MSELDNAMRELTELEHDLKSYQSLLNAREAALAAAIAHGGPGERAAARVRRDTAQALLNAHLLTIREQRREVIRLERPSSTSPAPFQTAAAA